MARRRKRRRGFLGRSKSEKRNRRGRRGSANNKQGLTTNGGEYLLNGKDYVGKYHVMDDGRAMTGPKHKGKGKETCSQNLQCKRKCKGKGGKD